LLIAFGFGIWFSTCWKNYQKNNITFENIRFQNQSNMSVDLYFTVNNPTYKNGKTRIYIQAYTNKNQKITSKITYIDLEPKSKQNFIKVLEKFERPLMKDEVIDKAAIEFY
jgi:hypothetical protein